MAAPSFRDLKPASAASSFAKSRNRRHDTRQELALRRALWRMGLRYRKNVECLPGKPDVVFSAARVAVFCDGDFWHGRDWSALQEALRRRANAAYWIAKIGANIERDQQNRAKLEADGWLVIRLWETDILRDPSEAAKTVNDAVRSRRASHHRVHT